MVGAAVRALGLAAEPAARAPAKGKRQTRGWLGSGATTEAVALSRQLQDVRWEQENALGEGKWSSASCHLLARRRGRGKP